MDNTLKNTFQIVSRSLNQKLTSTYDVLKIDRISDVLPDIPIVSDAGFECHLGTSELRTDFLVAFNSRNLSKNSWLNYMQILQQRRIGNYIWNSVAKFCDCWTDSKSTLYRNVDNIWLEFDLDRDELNSPEPSFFFAPKDISTDKIRHSMIDFEKHWIIDEALPILLNKSLDKYMKKQIKICFKSLPMEATIFQIGVMLPRQVESDTVRLCVDNIPKSKIFKYIIDIGWQERDNSIEKLFSEIFPLVDKIKLNFAVKDFIYPKLGFECYFDKQPKNSSKWKLFIKYLATKGLCTEEKAEALISWTGYTEAKNYSELWPESLAKASALVAPNFRSTIARTFHHIKIVYQPNRPLQAKAYLWFGHRWLSLNGTFQV